MLEVLLNSSLLQALIGGVAAAVGFLVWLARDRAAKRREGAQRAVEAAREADEARAAQVRKRAREARNETNADAGDRAGNLEWLRKRGRTRD